MVLLAERNVVNKRRKVRMNPEKYLTPEDREKIKEIKKAVKMSNDLSEIKGYEAQMEYLIKKAYIRMKMGLEFD
ncbi:hypothetical protein [Lysinibacillus xylanilyticus]|uniref:Transcriptional regulator n=1 Tax=Lysinibacillus xylanilyticus TaxID=582475 RepID=A0ABV3W038_9BACI